MPQVVEQALSSNSRTTSEEGRKERRKEKKEGRREKRKEGSEKKRKAL
jgi:hypothetical protein